MSSRSSRKGTIKGANAIEPIVTRTKSAQRRQLLNKVKKAEKPKLTKPEIKSPKQNKTAICSKDSLPKNPVKKTVEVDQVEYYPNKLKREIRTKKIMLEPKHNFKVIAATNKRKMATPQKGIKTSAPSKKQKPGQSLLKPIKSEITTRSCSGSELSMQDMVRIMEETRSLSDEDFMEILTCPSPVWWEDPPDARYIEGAIFSRSPEPPPPSETEKEEIRAKIETNKLSTNTNKKLSKIDCNPKQLKVTQNKKDETFVKKKRILENILGNIKVINSKNRKDSKDELKNNDFLRSRQISESTEGDISDISFNEDEILKNLENVDIPVENAENKLNDVPDNTQKYIDDVEIKKEIAEVTIEKIPLSNVKLQNKEEFTIKSLVSDADSVPDTNNQFISDVSLGEMSSHSDIKSDEVVIVDSCTNSGLADVDCSPNYEIVNKSTQDKNSTDNKDKDILNLESNDILPNKKVINDLSKYITVYKIIPEKTNNESIFEGSPAENSSKTKLDNVRGNLNDFFKQCKSNKRLKKTDNLISSIPLTDVKETTDNEKEPGVKIDLEDDKNRLKHCDCCIEKTVNTDFPCEKCEMAPILPCVSCNFLADTKEVYKNHVSSCKDVARISWNHNLLLNQT